MYVRCEVFNNMSYWGNKVCLYVCDRVKHHEQLLSTTQTLNNSNFRCMCAHRCVCMFMCVCMWCVAVANNTLKEQSVARVHDRQLGPTHTHTYVWEYLHTYIHTYYTSTYTCIYTDIPLFDQSLHPRLLSYFLSHCVHTYIHTYIHTYVNT